MLESLWFPRGIGLRGPKCVNCDRHNHKPIKQPTDHRNQPRAHIILRSQSLLKYWSSVHMAAILKKEKANLESFFNLVHTKYTLFIHFKITKQIHKWQYKRRQRIFRDGSGKFGRNWLWLRRQRICLGQKTFDDH